MSILDDILAHKRTEIARLDLAALKARAREAPPTRDFAAALARSPLSREEQVGEGPGVRAVRLIAELKRASPSRGMLAPDLDMLELARIYADNGASALSVLTDEKFFLGSLDTLTALRSGSDNPLPLLRKDFIVSEAQMYETRAAGADAVLLIVAALPDDAELAGLHALALELGMTPLVEAHDGAELERALRLPGLRLAGINNRDLRTFTVSLDTTLQLRPQIPAGDMRGVRVWHFHSCTRGPARRGRPGRRAGRRGAGHRARHRREGEGTGGMHVKICGLTNVDDALAAVEAGADLLGFNFYPPSPRCISPQTCASIIAAVAAGPRRVVTVGIFVNEAPERVQAILDECGLDLAQLHGDESPQVVAAFQGRAFKGIRGAQGDPAPFAAVCSSAPMLLVDAYSPKLYGGTGQTADWQAARTLAVHYPILLAGGLTPDNVAEAVRQVRPWGVDTASGVEIAPGRKDHQKIRAFVEAAQDALTTKTPEHEDAAGENPFS